MTKRTIPIVGTLLACAAVAVALWALNPLAQSSATSQPETTGAAPTLDPALTSGFAVFRTAATREGVPQILRDSPESVLPAHSAVDAVASEARLAQTTSDGVEVYLVPLSTGGVCLVTSSTSEDGCATRTALLAGEATSSDTCSSSLPADTIEIAGIVPDGVRDAVVTLDDGTHVPLVVRNNTYVARFARDGALPRTIGWAAGDGGHHEVDAMVPADTATMDCEPSGAAVDLRDLRPGPAPKQSEPEGHVIYNNG